jgi:hypothetical protein
MRYVFKLRLIEDAFQLFCDEFVVNVVSTIHYVPFDLCADHPLNRIGACSNFRNE